MRGFGGFLLIFGAVLALMYGFAPMQVLSLLVGAVLLIAGMVRGNGPRG